MTDINNEQAELPDSVVLDVASDDEPTPGLLPDLEPGLLSSSLTIGQTQSKKCNGYVPTNITSSIWTSYPFQLFQLQPNHNFVFENGSFHTIECYDKCYALGDISANGSFHTRVCYDKCYTLGDISANDAND